MIRTKKSKKVQSFKKYDKCHVDIGIKSHKISITSLKHIKLNCLFNIGISLTNYFIPKLIFYVML